MTIESPANLDSSAPHLRNPAAFDGPLNDWGVQPDVITGSSKSSGILLYKSRDGQTESGLWQCSAGSWPLSIPRDEVCHFVSGRADYVSASGEVIKVNAGTVALFPAGWKGICTVHETMRNVYMLNDFGILTDHPRALVLNDPVAYPGPFKDWGEIPTMIEGSSKTSGILLHKGPEGRSESGIWICTPGFWNCHVTRNEFCHFLSGRCTYTHESGEVIEIKEDTVAFFPKDWRGSCRVHETIRKVYMIS